MSSSPIRASSTLLAQIQVSDGGRARAHMYYRRIAGREFINRDVRAALERLGVQIYRMRTAKTHAAEAENAIRRLKSRLWRAMAAARAGRRWIHLLDTVVQAMNNTPSRALNGRTPASITADEALNIAREAILGEPLRRPPSYSVREQVRMRIPKNALLSKGYEQTFSDQAYEVTHVHAGNRPARYRIASVDADGARHPQPGIFYSQDLSPYGVEEGSRQWKERL